MRRLLAALALLVAVVMLYQGLVLRGVVEGAGERLHPEAARFLLGAGGVTLIATATLRWSAGIAAVEMALAGLAAIGIGILHPDHRYLAAYGAAALALALAAMLVDLVPDPVTRPQRAPILPEQRKQHEPAWEHNDPPHLWVEAGPARRSQPIRRQHHRPTRVSFPTAGGPDRPDAGSPGG